MQFNIPAEHKNASGVYIIRNSVNSKVYVGSATSLRERYCQHKRELKKGTHHSTKLQRFANKYGVEALMFDLLEVVETSRSELRIYEQKWLDFYQAAGQGGMNIVPWAGIGNVAALGYKLKCQMCNTEFWSKNSGKQKFCSIACKGNSQRGRALSPQCLEKSKAVQAATIAPDITTKCLRCEKVILCRPGYVATHGYVKKYCSRECCNAARVGTHLKSKRVHAKRVERSRDWQEKISSALRKPKVECKCRNCGALFYTRPSQTAKFCSKACYHAAKASKSPRFIY